MPRLDYISERKDPTWDQGLIFPFIKRIEGILQVDSSVCLLINMGKMHLRGEKREENGEDS